MPLYRDIILLRLKVLNSKKTLCKVIDGILEAPDIGTLQCIDIAAVIP